MSSRAQAVHRPTLTYSALTILVLLAWTTGPGPFAFEPDLAGSNTKREAVAKRLLSVKPGEWREAQLRLAASGPAGLDAVVRARILHSPVGRRRAADVARIGLLLSIPYEELARRPEWVALIQDSVRLAAYDVDALPARLLYEEPGNPNVTSAEEDSLFASEYLRPRDRVLRWGGFAVPAVLARLRSPGPAERGAACRLLGALGARAQVAALDPLAGDEGAFDRWQGDYEDRITVGAVSVDEARTLRAEEDPPFRYELAFYAMSRAWDSYTASELCNAGRALQGLQHRTGALPAPETWDEWWNYVRPAWDAWWELCGNELRPTDPAAWHRLTLEYADGLHRAARPGGRLRH